MAIELPPLPYAYDALGGKLSAESAVTLTGVSGTNCHTISTAVCSKET